MKRKFLTITLLAAILSLACTTRVSEWILLNAPPNQYTLVYFHNTPISESLQKQNQNVADGINAASIQFKTVNRQEISKPYYGLYYEGRLFSTFKTVDELRGLTSSPLREQVASELMAGKLCVMLYLKTDNKEKDEKGLRALHSAIGSSPFGNIISVVELSRNSREEHHFASLLLNIEDDLKDISEPMLFGIIGKFKALEPLLGRGITEENIKLMIDYFTAECSCLIKDDLPGTDILFTNQWEDPQTALLNKIIDDNPGLGYQMETDTLSYESLDSRPLPKWLVDQKSGITTIQPEELVMKEDHSLKISMAVTLGVIFLVVVLLTLLINRKHKKQAS